MTKRVLITGGYGFIGSALIRKLLDLGEHEILNIDMLSYSSNLKNIPSKKKLNNYSFQKIDICNFDEVRNLISEFQPQKIFHLAAESHVDNSIKSSKEFIQTNIIGTYNLLEVSRMNYPSFSKSNEEFRFIHISTDEVFGDLDNNPDSFFHENYPYNPSSPYSASKASSDHLVRAWNRTYKLPAIITNCSNNYGPFQHKEKLIPKTITNAIEHKKIPIYGNGMQIRDWLFVNDHVEALLNVASKGKVGSTYCIGGKNEVKNLELVKEICHILDRNIPSSSLNSYSDLISFVDDRPGHDLRYAIDISNIKSELGWEPNTSFKDGLEETVLWYLNNRDWWS